MKYLVFGETEDQMRSGCAKLKKKYPFLIEQNRLAFNTLFYSAFYFFPEKNNTMTTKFTAFPLVENYFTIKTVFQSFFHLSQGIHIQRLFFFLLFQKGKEVHTST